MIKHAVRTALVGTVLLGLSVSTGFAQSVKVLGDFNAWHAYASGNGGSKICFVMSEPSSVDPKPDGYTKAYLYLTHRPADNIRNEFNFVAGYTFAADDTAKVTVGSQTFDLFTQDDAAWLQDPGQNGRLAGLMRAGSSLTIEGTTDKGIKIKSTFSLSGVTAASRAMDNACG